MSLTTAGFEASLPRVRPLRRVRTIARPQAAQTASAAPLLAALLPILERRGSLVVHLIAAEEVDTTARLARALAEAAGRHAWCRTRILHAAGRGDGPDILALHRATGALPAGPVDCVLPLAGASIPRPAELVALYDALRRDSDLIIVDCPPLAHAPDTALLSTAADRTLLVAAAERSRLRALDRATGLLDAAGVERVGLVMLGERRLPSLVDHVL